MWTGLSLEINVILWLSFHYCTAELPLSLHHQMLSSSRWQTSPRQVSTSHRRSFKSWCIGGVCNMKQVHIYLFYLMLWTYSGQGNGKYCCPKIYFNHRCFSGPYLNKGRIAELPQFIGPGNCVLVLKEVRLITLFSFFISTPTVNDSHLPRTNMQLIA